MRKREIWRLVALVQVGRVLLPKMKNTWGETNRGLGQSHVQFWISQVQLRCSNIVTWKCWVDCLMHDSGGENWAGDRHWSGISLCVVVEGVAVGEITDKRVLSDFIIHSINICGVPPSTCAMFVMTWGISSYPKHRCTPCFHGASRPRVSLTLTHTNEWSFLQVEASTLSGMKSFYESMDYKRTQPKCRGTALVFRTCFWTLCPVL